MESVPRVVCLATQGTGSLDELRILALLEELSPSVLPFDRLEKKQSALAVMKSLRGLRPDLVVMEGTGIAGGTALMAARKAWGIPYVVSSGDAVGPFWGLQRRSLQLPGSVYERALLRLSDGFIGWSPYLVGRALTLGAPRAMTAANWSPPSTGERRVEIRRQLGIPSSAITFGIAGSLIWNTSVSYCYGLELVEAVRRVERRDLRVLIVGDGSGLPKIREAAGDDPRIVLTGRIPREDVPAYLSAMDIGSLPQSVDGVGSFRYTTKLSEYLAASLPVATTRVPFSYDLDDGWLWRLAGHAPWSQTFVNSLAALMARVSMSEIHERRKLVPVEAEVFSKARQQRQVANFIRDIISDVRAQQ